jgi:hypothetical protein
MSIELQIKVHTANRSEFMKYRRLDAFPGQIPDFLDNFGQTLLKG